MQQSLVLKSTHLEIEQGWKTLFQKITFLLDVAMYFMIVIQSSDHFSSFPCIALEQQYIPFLHCCNHLQSAENSFSILAISDKNATNSDFSHPISQVGSLNFLLSHSRKKKKPFMPLLIFLCTKCSYNQGLLNYSGTT